MKIRMTAGLSGGVTKSPGDPYETDAAEAKRLIDAGFAVPWTDDPIERAEQAPPPETRSAPRAPRNRKKEG